MIHADGDIVVAAGAGMKHRIGRHRAVDGISFGAQRLQHRDDQVNLVAAHCPAFARMRIQPCHGNAGRCDCKIADQPCGRDADRLGQQIRRQLFGNICQRDVDGDRHDPQGITGQHHHRLWHARQMRKILGMAGKAKARAVFQRFLMDRGRANRRCLSRLHQSHSALDHGNHARGILRGRGARHVWRRKTMRQHRQHIWPHAKGLRGFGDLGNCGPCGQMTWVTDPEKWHRCAQNPPRGHRQFWPYACGFAAGQGNGRCHRHLTDRRLWLQSATLPDKSRPKCQAAD